MIAKVILTNKIVMTPSGIRHGKQIQEASETCVAYGKGIN